MTNHAPAACTSLENNQPPGEAEGNSQKQAPGKPMEAVTRGSRRKQPETATMEAGGNRTRGSRRKQPETSTRKAEEAATRGSQSKQPETATREAGRNRHQGKPRETARNRHHGKPRETTTLLLPEIGRQNKKLGCFRFVCKYVVTQPTRTIGLPRETSLIEKWLTCTCLQKLCNIWY